MAQQGVQLDQEQFCCSICLDLLKDPVSVPCGHNYCSRCIEAHWNQDNQRGRFNCPQCTETFIPRPVLKKNIMLAEVVESLKRTEVQGVPLNHCYAGPGDVSCDFCTGRKLKAVKTCLQCLVSYCDTHLQPHYQSPAFKKHKLVKASSKLQENICSRHDEVKKVFCRTDQQCICYLCSMEDHKGHDTISATAEMTERQKELETSQQNIQQRIQEREKDVKVLYQEAESINHSADRAVEDSVTIFTDFTTYFERRQSEVRELIKDKQKQEVSRVEEQRKCVKQEVTELRSRHAELEQLSHTEDPIHFLDGYTSLSKISESTHPVSSNVRPLRYFEDVIVAVSQMKDKLENIVKEEGTNISDTVNRADILLATPPEPKTKAEFLQTNKLGLSDNIIEMQKVTRVIVAILLLLITLTHPIRSSEPKSRAEFLQHAYPITLDPNAANEYRYLLLSKENRQVTLKREIQYVHSRERFTGLNQVVLSREGLTGHCYWEVEWSGHVFIAVSYKDFTRTSTDQNGFGYNDKSWILQCWKEGYMFRHSGIETKIPGCVSSRVGVYLDHSAGTLSFYAICGVSDTMTLLHRVQTTFTQTLYAGFGVFDYGDTVELIDLK